jgi:hypothetical protein
MSVGSSEDLYMDPKLTELQEELRHVVFKGISNISTDASVAWDAVEQERPAAEAGLDDIHSSLLDLPGVTIPRIRLVRYLQNWVTECATYLDKFDTKRHFQIQVPLIAQTCPALLCALLAFSSKQLERRGLSHGIYDSLELYQESIKLLGPSLQAKDPNVLVTACILAVFELMCGSSKNWRRHLEGCAALFELFGVHGFSGGVAQAVFWCYARMALCGGIISAGDEAVILPLETWCPPPPLSMKSPAEKEGFARSYFHRHSRRDPDAHANWSVYLCASVCDLRFRRTQYLELGKTDTSDKRSFTEQWAQIWSDLGLWLEERPKELLPVFNTAADNQHPFPGVLFSHWAAISSNQLYHTACILMLEIRPLDHVLLSPESSAIWHARRVCGISYANPHRGNLINSIQPLYVAGRLFTHESEQLEIAKMLKTIDQSTGWGALWRLRDLEAEWGYEAGEILKQLSSYS